MKIAPDKWKHFIVGIFLGLIFQAVLLFFMPGQTGLTIILTLSIVIVISYGFELFSLITGMGHYELMDAVAAVIGGVIGQAAVLICFSLL
ncbi:MAG: hypothetical protein JWN76_3145 [Chitinophagaceae bacterium]|nr:hypothetical protein [Chitinophagaceae bacterium]